MNITKSEKRGVVILNVEDNISFKDSSVFRNTVAINSIKKNNRIILNFEDSVEYMDKAAVMYLLDIARKLIAVDAKIIFTGVNGTLKKCFQKVKIFDIFEFKSYEDAFKALA